MIQKDKIISEMLPYEIDMLRHSYRRLQSPLHDQADVNAFIECFCVHARNLLDFFWDAKPKQKKHAVARHFIAGCYHPFERVSPKTNGLYGKLNDQIAHITYGRTDVMEEKIGPVERAYLKDLVEKQIENFSRHIDPLYLHLWKRQGEFPSNASASPNTRTSIELTTSSGTLVGGGPIGPSNPPKPRVGATGPINTTDRRSP
jgi:hypothetical protein